MKGKDLGKRHYYIHFPENYNVPQETEREYNRMVRHEEYVEEKDEKNISFSYESVDALFKKSHACGRKCRRRNLRSYANYTTLRNKKISHSGRGREENPVDNKKSVLKNTVDLVQNR